LAAADAVAAIVVLDDGRYLMHLRDDKPGIWYPDHSGCLGGAVDPGETSERALIRELQEEIGYTPTDFCFFTRHRFDLRPFGQGDVFRDFFVVPMPAAVLPSLTVMEGREVQPMDGQRLLVDCRLVPYDAFALWMHLSQDRLRAGASSPRPIDEP
jgi:8-oxo-dGTP pyrophosphatase MutT (NUDIX family)